ncbi:hypothetical protein [Lysobacter gummosus]|uniref:hypothetical protein n=1 Tax=Lysobacter gummosus TaxID=262324 RepID=UPI00363F05BA
MVHLPRRPGWPPHPTLHPSALGWHDPRRNKRRPVSWRRENRPGVRIHGAVG